MPIPWAGRSEDKTDDVVWGVTCFAAAGFTEVVQPTVRRVVMRIDFDDQVEH